MSTLRLFRRHVKDADADDADAVTAFRQHLNRQRLTATPARVLEADLRSRSRMRRISLARHHAAWELSRRRLDMTYQQIAAELDRVNHATALHAVQTFNEYKIRGQFATEIAAVAKALDAP
jgi:chromosomal replication initiation ATPase DnaA